MEFTKDTDADLLGYMAMEKDDPDAARAAWGEFFTRNRDYLFRVARSCYGSQLGGDEGVADVVADAFLAARSWAMRRGLEPRALDRFQDATPQLVQRRVRAWLGRIAENRFKDIMRRGEQRPIEVEHPEDLAHCDLPVELSTPMQARLELLEAALATLSEQDQAALRGSLPWYDDETQQFTFGPGEAEALAAELGTNVDALRQRRHRALKRLKKAMIDQLVAAQRKGGQL